MSFLLLSVDHIIAIYDNDGNKRTAFQVMDLILDLNGINAIWDVEAVGQKIVLLSQSKLDETDLAQWLRRVAV